MHEHEAQLWANYQLGRSVAARNALVEHYLPLLPRIAERMAKQMPPTVTVDELISAGAIELVGLVERFQIDRGNRFSTLAYQRLCGAMRDHLRRQDWLPRLDRQRQRCCRSVRARLVRQLGREPELHEVAAAVRAEVGRLLERPPTDREVAKFLAAEQPPTMLQLEVPLRGRDECEKPATLREKVPAVTAPPWADLQRDDLLRLCGRCLSPIERQIVDLYFFRARTMKSIGESIDLCESRVSQMMRGILAKLRSFFSQGDRIQEFV